MAESINLSSRNVSNDPTARKMVEKIVEIEQNMCKLKEETDHLIQIKNQRRIYLQMYMNDYDSMKSLYLSMKNQLLYRGKNNFQPLNLTSTNLISQPNPQQILINSAIHQNIGDMNKNSKFLLNSQNSINNNSVDGQNDGQSELQNGSQEVQNELNESIIVPYDLQWEIFSEDQFYNNSTVQLCYALNASSILCSIQFDSTGERFAFADGKTVFLVRTVDGAILASFAFPNDQSLDQKHTREVCFSPDDRYILVSAPSANILIFSIESQSLVGVLEAHENLVTSLKFIPNTFLLLSGGLDGTLCLWDFEKQTLIKKIKHGETNEKQEGKEMITSIALACDNSFIAVGFMSGSVGIYEPTFAHSMNVFRAHQDSYVIHISSANQSSILATSSNDNTIKIWVMRNVASCKQTLIGHSNCVITSCFSNDDSILFSGSKDETIKAWDYKTGKLLFTIAPHQNTVFDISHHPTKNLFVSCMGDGVVCLWKYLTKP